MYQANIWMHIYMTAISKGGQIAGNRWATQVTQIPCQVSEGRGIPSLCSRCKVTTNKVFVIHTHMSCSSHQMTRTDHSRSDVAWTGSTTG